MFLFKRLISLKIETILKYYKSPKFALLDLSFSLIAFFINPYRTCRKFLQKKGKTHIHSYGETPYSTYQKIVEECGIGPEDLWIEVGAGRGKGCFWLAHFVGCKVIGIEWVPLFVRFAKVIKILFRIKNVHFEKKDIQEYLFPQATVLYLYGLDFKLDLTHLPSLKIITTAEPLAGYSVIKQFWVRFPWGRTTAFLQKKD